MLSYWFLQRTLGAWVVDGGDAHVRSEEGSLGRVDGVHRV